MPPRLDFARLLTLNFAAVYHFYRDVLGLTPGFGSETDTYADFTLGQVNISLFDATEMAEAINAPAPVSSHTDSICLVFGVENVDEMVAAMQTRGAVFVAGPTDHPDWGIRTAHLRDPDGRLIEINHPISLT